MITLADYWMGRDVEYADELTEEIRANAQITVDKVNALLERSNFVSIDSLNSGWRPRAVNEATSNAATGSKHITGQAADIPDRDRALSDWAVHSVPVLEDLGLFIEDPRWCPSWLHVQTVPPRSGKRIFIPSLKPPSDPSFPVTWLT